jgi:hypothetical protein
LIPFLDGKKNGCKWVFKNKNNLDGNVENKKAMLVVKGNS